MQFYLFTASNVMTYSASVSLNEIENSCGEYFVVALSSKEEFDILIELLRIGPLNTTLLEAGDFLTMYDFSEKSLPELTVEEFDSFYMEWLTLTGRESNMDEYGQLLFLQGYGREWNRKSRRFILQEKS